MRVSNRIRRFLSSPSALCGIAGGLGAGLLTACFPAPRFLTPAHAELSHVQPKARRTVTTPEPVSHVDPRVRDLIERIRCASHDARTLSADFTYTVESARRHQLVSGSVEAMKPNYLRFRFGRMTEPAFPNLIGSDGTTAYFFTPRSFDEQKRIFDPDADYTSARGARAASGEENGMGKFTSGPADPDGRSLGLWDSMAVEAFFTPDAALRWLYYGDLSELKYEGIRTIDGVPYRVIRHDFAHGSIEGGDPSPFVQRVYVGPDDLIRRFDLEFRCAGRPGHQSMQLHNVRLNAPMNPDDFAFTPPPGGHSAPASYRVTAP